jgi:hypothetical protein
VFSLVWILLVVVSSCSGGHDRDAASFEAYFVLSEDFRFQLRPWFHWMLKLTVNEAFFVVSSVCPYKRKEIWNTFGRTIIAIFGTVLLLTNCLQGFSSAKHSSLDDIAYRATSYAGYSLSLVPDGKRWFSKNGGWHWPLAMVCLENGRLSG